MTTRPNRIVVRPSTSNCQKRTSAKFMDDYLSGRAGWLVANASLDAAGITGALLAYWPRPMEDRKGRCEPLRYNVDQSNRIIRCLMCDRKLVPGRKRHVARQPISLTKPS